MSFLMSLLSGGMTGILGSVISRYADYKNKKLDREHERAMLQAEAEVMKEEWKQRVQVAKAEGEAKVEVEDARAFADSYKLEPKQYFKGDPGKLSFLYILLDFLRGSIRPVLTLYLCGVTTAIYLHVYELLGGSYDVLQLNEVFTRLVDTVLYLTTTVVLWWFGTRAKKQPKN